MATGCALGGYARAVSDWNTSYTRNIWRPASDKHGRDPNAADSDDDDNFSAHDAPSHISIHRVLQCDGSPTLGR